jgi:hypothetical protein
VVKRGGRCLLGAAKALDRDEALVAWKRIAIATEAAWDPETESLRREKGRGGRRT